MTRTGRILDEYLSMGAAGIVALISFIKHLPSDAALNKARNPKDEYGVWNTTMKTNAMLAELFDLIVATHTRKGAQPKKYPRPQGKRGIGRKPIPLKDFWSWWLDKE